MQGFRDLQMMILLTGVENRERKKEFGVRN
jgi:hypothetical protein